MTKKLTLNWNEVIELRKVGLYVVIPKNIDTMGDKKSKCWIANNLNEALKKNSRKKQILNPLKKIELPKIEDIKDPKLKRSCIECLGR